MLTWSSWSAGDGDRIHARRMREDLVLRHERRRGVLATIRPEFRPCFDEEVGLGPDSTGFIRPVGCAARRGRGFRQRDAQEVPPPSRPAGRGNSPRRVLLLIGEEERIIRRRHFA